MAIGLNLVYHGVHIEKWSCRPCSHLYYFIPKHITNRWKFKVAGPIRRCQKNSWYELYQEAHWPLVPGTFLIGNKTSGHFLKKARTGRRTKIFDTKKYIYFSKNKNWINIYTCASPLSPGRPRMGSPNWPEQLLRFLWAQVHFFVEMIFLQPLGTILRRHKRTGWSLNYREFPFFTLY